MHDPSLLLFGLRIRRLRLDIWHDEPGGRDATEVCGHPPMPIPARLRWAVRHARHLHYRFWPYLHVKRWIKDRAPTAADGSSGATPGTATRAATRCGTTSA